MAREPKQRDTLRIVCGRHASKAALASGMTVSIKVVSGSNADLVTRAKELGVDIEFVTEKSLARLAGTDKNQGVVATCQPKREKGWQAAIAGAANPMLVVLDQVQDPRNLGACLRSCAAMGVQALIHPKRRCATLTPAACKVAGGAQEHVAVDVVPNICREINAMKKLGFTVIGTDSEGDTDIYELERTGPVALVLGGEGSGIRKLTRESCDVIARIAMPGANNMPSVNVSVACGICLSALVYARSRR